MALYRLTAVMIDEKLQFIIIVHFNRLLQASFDYYYSLFGTVRREKFRSLSNQRVHIIVAVCTILIYIVERERGSCKFRAKGLVARIRVVI